MMEFFVPSALSVLDVAILTVVSFAGSFITMALGIGGGALLLAVMASIMPAAALIPVHGVIQLGSNAFRSVTLMSYVSWKPVGWFVFGTVIGVAIGGMIAIQLPAAIVQICVGVFVIWNVLSQPPKWLSTAPTIIGVISSFLTMFFGATGTFGANFTKSLTLPRHQHVATHGMLMSAQHFFKVAAFTALGFSFSRWVGFLALMIIAGFVGTLVGKLVLNKMTDHGFKRALDIVLILISIRLIISGGLALM